MKEKIKTAIEIVVGLLFLPICVGLGYMFHVAFHTL